MTDSKFLKVAKQAAFEAGKVIKKYSGKIQNKNIKFGDPSDFATEADIEAEKLIISVLSKNFPDHNIITEEQENIEKGSEYSWVVDPLDGSITFTLGIPYFSVSIGLIRNGYPILGVINIVSFNDLYWGQVGQGAYVNGQTIRVSKRDKLEGTAMVLDFGHNQKRQTKIDSYIIPLITKIACPFSFGSAASSMALVAQASLDANVNQAWLWDFVAGTVIVREAGGKVTDFEGKEPDWTKERLNIVASNGLIHNQILEALKR